jgi:threonine synthase
MAGATIARKTTGTAASDAAFQQCIHPACAATFSIDEAHFSCPACGDVVDVVYDWDRLPVPRRLSDFEARWANRLEPLNFSGVWRFRDLLPFATPNMVVTIGEGQTLLQKADKVGQYVGMSAGNLLLQYEGMNPSGSFKDNGMTAAFTHARMVGARRVACASTGNTSAALAVYCSATEFGFRAIIFIGSGKIAYGKLAQALDHGALTIQIKGDFDDAMLRVRQVSDRLGIYLMNSVNPFRLEGSRLDRRSGGQPGKLERLWKGVHRALAPGADLAGASTGGHQRGRGPNSR